MIIWKYPLPGPTDEFTIKMPRNAKILCVQKQHGVPCMWAMTSGDDEVIPRVFRIIGTGNPFDDASWLQYIGTFQELEVYLVRHLFEKVVG